jgi:hypothetical protein
MVSAFGEGPAAKMESGIYRQDYCPKGASSKDAEGSEGTQGT